MLYVGICGTGGDATKIARKLGSSAGATDRVSLYLVGAHYRCIARGRSSVAFAPASAALNSTIVGRPTATSVSAIRTDILSTQGETGIRDVRFIASGETAEKAVIEHGLKDLTTSWTWIPVSQETESLVPTAVTATVHAGQTRSKSGVGAPASSTVRNLDPAVSLSGSTPTRAAAGTASTEATEPPKVRLTYPHGSFGVAATLGSLLLIMGQSGIGLKWALVASIIVGAMLGRADGKIARRERAIFTDLVALFVVVAGAWFYFTEVLAPGSVGQWPVSSFLVLTGVFVFLFTLGFVGGDDRDEFMVTIRSLVQLLPIVVATAIAVILTQSGSALWVKFSTVIGAWLFVAVLITGLFLLRSVVGGTIVFVWLVFSTWNARADVIEASGSFFTLSAESSTHAVLLLSCAVGILVHWTFRAVHTMRHQETGAAKAS